MYKQLTSEQRYTISVLLQKGETKSAIANAIGVHPSTITRELRRNTGSRGKYVWETAQRNAAYHKHRQPGNRTVGRELRQEVESLLRKEQWSPEQISGHLKLQGKHIAQGNGNAQAASAAARLQKGIYIINIEGKSSVKFSIK